MDHQIELGYLVVELPDPDVVSPVFADLVGLIPGDPVDGALTWRDDDRAQRIVVETGPANDAVAVGLEVIDAGAFDATVERLRVSGFDVTEASDDHRRRRRVDRLVETPAPWGAS